MDLIPRATVAQICAASTRVCRVCLVEKQLTSEFFSQTTSKKPKRYFTGRCRLCDATASRENWRNNPNSAEIDRARRQPRREKIRAYDRMRYARDHEKRTENVARWRRENPDKLRAANVVSQARRRARLKLMEPGKWSKLDIQSLYRAQRAKCWWCPKKIRRGFHIDHRIPIAKGGPDNLSNLVLSCPTCNRKKSHKMPWQLNGRLL